MNLKTDPQPRPGAFALAMILLAAVWAAGCGKEVSLAGDSGTGDESRQSLREQLQQIRGLAEAPEVPVVKLAPGAIAEVVSITGELVPSDSVIVRPLMDGRVRFLRPIKVGDTVKAGEVIAKIDDRDIEDEIERQKQQIEISKEKLSLNEAQLGQRKKDLTFDEQLVKKGFLNEYEFEQSKMNLREAEINLRQSQLELEQENNRLQEAQRKREKVPIVAPIAGMIVPASHLKSGEQGASPLLNEEIMSLEDTLVGSSSELFGIVSSEGYLAQCLVNGKDKARLKEGQSARLTVISYRPIEVAGVVSRLSLLQDPRMHAYKVWLRLEEVNPSFISGLFVRADVELARRDTTLVVEKKFVKQRNNRSFVQIVQDDRVRDAWVETGLSDETRVELLSGVKQGEMLIASADIIAADQAVRPGVISLAEAAPESIRRFQAPAASLPLRMSVLGGSSAVTIKVEDQVTSGTPASLRLTLNDLDQQREAQLFVNSQGPLPLPPSLIGETQSLSATLDLPPGWVRSGDNELKFVFADNLGGSTAGYTVEGVELMLGR